MDSLQSWVAEHKLATVGTLWASAVGASLAYTRKRYPLKGGVRLIHARMHAQALTLAVLSGMAIKHYYFDAQRDMDGGELWSNQCSGVDGGSDESEERWSW